MKEELFSLANLKYFCDAVRLGGLSAAAKSNFVSQSAISQGISKLERSLGVSLLAHHPNRLRLTPQGESVFLRAQDLLRKITEFQHTLSEEENRSVGHLNFACTHSFALAVVPPFLKRFREEQPQAKINFFLGNQDNILQKLKEGAVDFGILPLEICQNNQCQPYEADLSAFEKRVIYSGHFELYTSKKIKRGQEQKLGFILTPPDSKEVVFLKEVYLQQYGNDLAVILEVGSWEIIADLVAEGMGIGYLPDYIAKRRSSLLQACDFGFPQQEYRISAISPKGMKLRKSSDLFLSYF